MTELKPCPLCGGKALLHRQDQIHSNSYDRGVFKVHYGVYVECEECRLETGMFPTAIKIYEDGAFENESNGYEKAVEAWNRRVEP